LAQVESPQLGSFLYALKLSTMPTGEQRALHYKVALGEAQTLKFRFINYLRKAETYKVVLGGGGDFQVRVPPSLFIDRLRSYLSMHSRPTC